MKHVYCISYTMKIRDASRQLCAVVRYDKPIVNNQQIHVIEQQMNAHNEGYVDITGVTYLGYHKIEEGM